MEPIQDDPKKHVIIEENGRFHIFQLCSSHGGRIGSCQNVYHTCIAECRSHFEASRIVRGLEKL
jgi:hypothetical protein